jgi:hypothetical protein
LWSAQRRVPDVLFQRHQYREAGRNAIAPLAGIAESIVAVQKAAPEAPLFVFDVGPASF